MKNSFPDEALMDYDNASTVKPLKSVQKIFLFP